MTAARAARAPGALALGIAVVLAVALAVSPDQAAAQSGRPNVVVVQSDDERLDDLRVMRKTLRQLGRKGTTFKNQIATHPRCCPSRATYLTGQYSHNHGVQANSGPKGGHDRLDHSRALPVWLDRAGYTTGHVGKYLNGYNGRNDPPGWDEFYGSLPPSTRLYGYSLKENGKAVKYGGRTSDYQTDVFADKAVNFIRRHANDSAPFFLSVNPSAPHTESGKFRRVGPNLPRNPRPAQRDFRRFSSARLPKPPSFDERDVSDKPRFIRQLRRISDKKEKVIRKRHISRLESLLAVDHLVNRVVRTLGSTGELRRTLIVFTSDNGYFRGEHRLPSRKAELYEPAVRVPLLIRGPGFPGGVTRRQLTGNIDLAPTILDVTRAQSPGRKLDGISLRPLARNGRRGRGRDLLLDTGIGDSKGVRTSRYVYIKHDGGEEELYDLKRDPHQLESLHRDRRYNDVERRLTSRLRRLKDCSGASCR